MRMMKRILLAFDQGACLILTGQNDFTLSGWAYLQAVGDGPQWPQRWINKLFYWQPEHCLSAFKWEMREAKGLYLRYRSEYDKVK